MKNHSDHEHVDYDKAGHLPPGGMRVNRGTKPERVLTPAQTRELARLLKLRE